jgi:phospholipid/cholesterol/gamma-HCH transport system substrate-binding protein
MTASDGTTGGGPDGGPVAAGAGGGGLAAIGLTPGGGAPRGRPRRSPAPPPSRQSITAPLVKSIVFILVTALATALLGISIANSGVTGTVGYRAVFSDVSGLTVGDDVDIAGVRIGQVTSIGVYRRYLALVGFTVQPGRSLPTSVTAQILYRDLVGQRYIELGQGAGPVGRMLAPGGTIPMARTTPALNLTELFNGFQPLFQALSPGDVNRLSDEIIQLLQGEGASMDSLLVNIASLTNALAAKDRVIDEVIGNLNAVVQTINSRGNDLAQTVAVLQQLVTGLAADRQPIGQAISALGSLTSATAGLLQVGRAPLHTDIVALGQLSTNLADNSPAVATFLQNLPVKMNDIARLASYGSWLNLYLCDATVTGARSALGAPAPTGVPITASRCLG